MQQRVLDFVLSVNACLCMRGCVYAGVGVGGLYLPTHPQVRVDAAVGAHSDSV